MVFVSFIIIFAIYLAYAEDRGIIKKGLVLSFWIICIVFSLRYGYGNDFKSYQEWFYSIIKYPSLSEAISGLSNMEFGWVVLNYLCKPFGFQLVIAITTFCTCYIYYYLINKYIPRPYKWVGVLLFLMYPNLFMLNLSMLRQGLAGALFFVSCLNGYENKRIWSIIFFLLATSIHTVAIICAPFVLMVCFKQYLHPELLILVVIVGFITLYLYPSIIENVFADVMSNDFAYESYSNYMSREGLQNVGLALFARIVVVFPSIIWFRGLKEVDKYLVILFCMSPFTILLSTQNSLLLRLECFFLPFSTIIFPRLLRTDCVFERRPKNWKMTKTIMKVASLGWILFSVRSFFHFFSEPTYAKDYATFHTVLSNIL